MHKTKNKSPNEVNFTSLGLIYNLKKQTYKLNSRLLLT